MKKDIFIVVLLCSLLLLVSIVGCTRPPAVVYEGNGHTAGEPPVSKALVGEAETLQVYKPGGLEKAGHRFMGWNTASGGGGKSFQPYDILTLEDETIILYAQWAAGFWVRFDGNRHEAGQVPEPIFVAEMDGLDIPGFGDLRVRDLWLAGWSLTSESSGVPYQPGQHLDAEQAAALSADDNDVVLYADWRQWSGTYTWRGAAYYSEEFKLNPAIGSYSYYKSSFGEEPVQITGSYDFDYRGENIYIESPSEGVKGVRNIRMHTTSDDPQYRTYLQFREDGKRFWGLNSAYERGSEIVYRPAPDADVGYTLIIVNSAGICNDIEVIIRRGPGTSFERVGFTESMHVPPSDFLPKGTEVHVYGHLEDPDEIGPWFNYWYLVRLPGHAGYEGPVWVFGEFIDVEGLEAPAAP